MLQRRLRKGLVGLLAACATLGAGNLRAEMTTDPCAHSARVRSQLVESPRHTALEYDASLTGSEVLARASRDAKALGLPLVKTLAFGRVAIVEGSRADVAQRLQAAERIPVARLAPVYLAGGNPNPDSMLVLTSRLLLSFGPTTPERTKHAWLASHGFRLVRETGAGRTMVETGRNPDADMVEFAAELQNSTPLLTRASFEFLMTVEQTASDSIQVNDPFFRYQWPLFNSGDNTNADKGKLDEDMDAPRAWMFNQRNDRQNPGLFSKGTFGNPSLVVAVFDSGTEVTHEDLAQNIDPRVGSDYVDSGAPTPPLSVFGAHGTAVAGLILAATNNVGIVGVAPGVKLFTTRVIAPDNSTTNLSIQVGIEETISKDIDVNVHPYTLPVDNTEGLAAEVDLALREAFESGRDALGMPNLAATGNFSASVEFPASSKYAIAVSSVSSEGSSAQSSNWGGVGADIVGPSFQLSNADTYSLQSGTGVVTTDLSGNPGLAAQDIGTPGNESGAYTSIGFAQGFTGTALANTITFTGTSVAVGHMAGVMALMLSDNRYDELPPFFDPGDPPRNGPDYRNSRAYRRLRAPRFGDNLLSQMTAHADLPNSIFEAAGSGFAGIGGFSNQPNIEALSYIDQYNEFLGHGRPNPAKFIAVNEDTSAGAASGVSTPDSFFTSFLQEDTPAHPVELYNVTFAVAGPGRNGEEPLPEEQAQGWTIDTIAMRRIGDPPLNFVTSPYLEGVKRLYFEDGTTLDAPDGKFLYVWSDAQTSGPPEAASSEEWDPRRGTFNAYNPYGRYLSNGAPAIISPSIVPPEGSGGQPMLLTLQASHALGVENSSSNFGQNGTTARIIREVDKLNIEMVILSTTGAERRVLVSALTGDSWQGRKNRQLTATPKTVTNPAPDRLEPVWVAETGVEYRPYAIDEQMIIRTYRFLLPPIAEGESFQLRVQLVAGPSYLPEYKYENGIPTQIYNTRWDDRGFQLYSAKVNLMQRAAYDYLTNSNFVVASGSRLPTWSASMHDVFAVQDIGSEARALSVTESRPLYLAEDKSTVLRQPSQQLIESDERITGVKGHPFLEVLAMTTDNGEAQSLWMVSSDGVNQKRLVNPQVSAGARDPNWAINGKQLIYCGPEYIRIASIRSELTAPGDPTVVVETVLSSETTDLEDFHSPLLDFSGGNVIFTARRKSTSASADRSLQLFVANRNGRIFDYTNYSDCNAGPSRPIGSPFLYGWDNIDLYDLDLSVGDPAITSGRLIFAANASSAPVPPPNCSVDPGAPLTFTPAVPSSAAFLYTIENFYNVVNNNDAPIYTKVALNSPDVNYTVSARHPRISPNRRELLYTGFNLPVSQESNDNGLIIRQLLPAESKIPPSNVIVPTTPTPTPTPTSRPPVIVEGRVTFNAQNVFLESQEGWEFRTGGTDLSAPSFTFIQANGGSLRLQSINSLNTFGYVESSRGAIQVREGSLHLYRAYIRGTTSVASQAASLRLRVNSANLESAYTSDTNSRGDLKLSPVNSAAKHYDLLFRPAAGIFDAATGKQNYTAAVDLLNFFADDDPNAGIEIEKIELFRLDEAGYYYALWSFKPAANGTISLNAISSGAAEGELAIALRTCCSDNTTDVACNSGSSVSGAALDNIAVSAGRTYTVVVVAPFSQTVELFWNSSTNLTGSAPNACGVGGTGCSISEPISGSSGSDTQSVTFMGRGQTIDAPSCADLEYRTVISRIDSLYNADFSLATTRARWKPGPDPTTVPFQNPEFTQVDNTLALRVVNRSNTFGYWSSTPGTIPTGTVVASDDAPYVIYRARFMVANPYETDPLKVPDIRVRLATNDFQRIVTGNFISVREGRTVPTPDKPRNLEVYMVLEQIPGGLNSFVAGFDVLSFYPGRQITAQPMEMKALQIERVYIPDYPLPR